MTYAELLSALQSELATRFNLDAQILYRRTSDVVELTTRRVILQPSGQAITRTGKSEPCKTTTVDLISEEHVAQESVESVARLRVAEMERVATELTRRPYVGAAFCLSAETFDDAPAGVDSSILENGYALVLAGLRLTFVEN